MALGLIAPTSALGSVVRKAYRSVVSMPVLIFLTPVQPTVQTPAKKPRGRSSPRANQTSCLAPWSNSLKDVNGTTRLFAGSSQGFQCADAVLRTSVVPPSGSMRRSSSKSTAFPLASSFPARFFAASTTAFPSGPLRDHARQMGDAKERCLGRRVRCDGPFCGHISPCQ